MPSASPPQRQHLSAQTIAALPEQARPHPVNPRGLRHSRDLGAATGLTRLGVYLVRVAPGDESTALHSHQTEEEWLYILAGRGIADDGTGGTPVRPGDFLGFATDGTPHLLRNTGSEDLVYLLCGERRDYDTTDYPRDGRRLIRLGAGRHFLALPAPAGHTP